jgi:peptide/nickel transport system substrate-binding protein
MLRGGTLRVGIARYPGDLLFYNELWGTAALDPTLTGFLDSWELFRCCVARTLLSYPGRPTRQDGAIAQPDLAATMPEVSPDGLTWTFRLRPGLHYGPPLEDVEIQAHDIIRALERAILQGPNSFLYSVVDGFDAFAAGDEDFIAGLEAPDNRTLRVHLVEPTGDLGDRFAMPITAPIPPNPDDPGARLGVATGHDDGYGGFLVSSGPYMVEGSESLTFASPPEEQRPASGFVPGTSIVLVRNPSWDAETDPFRGAYPDRIEISFHASVEEAARALDARRIDLVFSGQRPPQAPPSQIEAYAGDPTKGFISIEPADTLQAIWMNLAVPPLDDVHVRKAMNLVVDKAKLQEILGGPDVGQIIGHIGLNSMENDLLLNYDPYGAPGQAGDVEAARREMSLSAYDRDGDGVCDTAECEGLLALAHDDPIFGASIADQLAADMRQIGIDLRVELMETGALFERVFDPTDQVPLVLTLAWFKALQNASDWFDGLFSSLEEGKNFSSLGASAEQLAGWGYPVTEVPNVDARIDSCLIQTGPSQLRCWADLDQYLMESVVPWVPYVVFNMINIVPARIGRFSFDQAASMPALDQIALAAPS